MRSAFEIKLAPELMPIAYIKYTTLVAYGQLVNRPQEAERVQMYQKFWTNRPHRLQTW